MYTNSKRWESVKKYLRDISVGVIWILAFVVMEQILIFKTYLPMKEMCVGILEKSK